MTEVQLTERLMLEPLLHNPTLPDSNLKQHPAPSVGAVLAMYRTLFSLYMRVYFSNMSHKLNSSGQSDAGHSGTWFVTAANHCFVEMGSLLPVDEIVKTLTASGITVSSVARMTAGDLSKISIDAAGDPMRRGLCLRLRKQRYIELWLQLSKAFRILNRPADALKACMEAQKVERYCADVEFEVQLSLQIISNLC